ncbi:hypothetical protein ACJJTC_005914 [Scirpophaga incertulas]
MEVNRFSATVHSREYAARGYPLQIKLNPLTRDGSAPRRRDQNEHMAIPNTKNVVEPTNVENLPCEVNDQALHDPNLVSVREESLSCALICCVCSEETTGGIRAECAIRMAYSYYLCCSGRKYCRRKCLKLLKKIPPVSLGTTVRIPVPEVDRGRGDARNILTVVLHKSDDDLYQLCTKQGVVKTLYSRQQFTVCHQKLLQPRRPTSPIWKRHSV